MPIQSNASDHSASKPTGTASQGNFAESLQMDAGLQLLSASIGGTLIITIWLLINHVMTPGEIPIHWKPGGDQSDTDEGIEIDSF